jgi:hypothetical protein
MEHLIQPVQPRRTPRARYHEPGNLQIDRVEIYPRIHEYVSIEREQHSGITWSTKGLSSELIEMMDQESDMIANLFYSGEPEKSKAAITTVQERYYFGLLLSFLKLCDVYFDRQDYIVNSDTEVFLTTVCLMKDLRQWHEKFIAISSVEQVWVWREAERYITCATTYLSFISSRHLEKHFASSVLTLAMEFLLIALRSAIMRVQPTS